MPNFIRQNEVSMANEHPKAQQPLLKSSCEMDKVPCKASIEHYPPGLTLNRYLSKILARSRKNLS